MAYSFPITYQKGCLTLSDNKILFSLIFAIYYSHDYEVDANI